MTETHYRLAADGIEVVFDPGSGMLRELAVTRDGRRSAPYAKAPWRDLPMDDPRFPADAAPHLARLSIDFFCAPFAADDIEGTAPHGKTANGRWRLVGEGRRGPVARATFALDGSIAGLTVTKTLLVIDGHPFLYQQHVLAGATVAIPVAHHAMVDASGGLELTTSPKAFAETAGTPIETDPALGRSILAYPARAADPRRFPLADGTTADLYRYPIGSRHEDVAMLVDAERAPGTLGWTIARRPAHDDCAILAKPADRLPQTMLWLSNGGRDYAPWLGEHRDVLGIEDGCTWSIHGWSASIGPNPLADAGIPTAVRVAPAAPVVISVAIGALPGTVVRSGDGFRAGGPDGAPIPFDPTLVTGSRRFDELA